jgi:NAD+ diphosphatase
LIQDIYPNRFDNHFVPDQKPGEHDFILYYSENALLLKAGDAGFELPRRKDFTSFPEDAVVTYLFKLNDVPCFLAWSKLVCDRDAFSFQDVASYRTMNPSVVAWVCLVGAHLLNWYTHNRFCGKCGQKMEHKEDERAMQCTECTNIVYPRISPAVIVAIRCDDQILLASNSSIPGRRFSLIAGFVDVGETLEEAVVREVKEEVGLEVRNICYHTSQPWPVSGSLMVGFTAEADNTQPLIVDTHELLEAGWYKRGALPNHSLPLSIAGDMIEKFEKGEL